MVLEDGIPNNLQTAADYNVQLPAFEGPLDLLLYLLKRDELDIYDIPIAKITSQYLSILRQLEHDNLDVAGEFFVMAATLMLIKSRMLLPPEVSQATETAQEEEGQDPRWALVEQLLEYKQFKEAAEALGTCMDDQSGYLPRKLSANGPAESRPLRSINPLELTSLFTHALVQLRERLSIGTLQAETVTLADRIAWVLSYLTHKSEFRFGELWDAPASKTVVATTFLALLELSRLKELLISQEYPFAEIFCKRLFANALEPLSE